MHPPRAHGHASAGAARSDPAQSTQCLTGRALLDLPSWLEAARVDPHVPRPSQDTTCSSPAHIGPDPGDL